MLEKNQEENIEILMERVKEKTHSLALLKSEISKVIIGQQYMVDCLLIALFGEGHILLEGVPGLAKTLAVRTLSEALGGVFSKIQFTPDLLPADIVGTMIYKIHDNDFSVKKGPIFANFVLADEINRAPAKVQSALLEAMQEKCVTIGDSSLFLPKPFLVLATQNPIEQEGTYLLPEAQTDRFMMKCTIDYPDFESEREIMRAVSQGKVEKVKNVMSISEIIECKELINKIYLDEKIEKYILDIIFSTRCPSEYGIQEIKDLVDIGASPRASINLAIASKVSAFIKGRVFVIPEDVKNVCKDVLRHRIGLSFEAEAEEVKVESIIDTILSKIQAP